MRLALPEHLAAALRGSGLSVIVTGAGGWIGGATLELLADALGPADFGRRVFAFAAQGRCRTLASGTTAALRPLAALDELEPGRCLLLHYAFLGREKVAEMPLTHYVAANEAIGACVRRAVARLRPRGVFLASSGAVHGPDGALETELARNPYGALKLRDEAVFAATCRAVGASLAIGRIFNLAGPYINKLESYALACFIRDALAGRPIAVRARRRVERSYVQVGDVVALALSALLDPQEEVAAFETAGERVVEVGELAALVGDLLRPGLAIERPPLDPALGADRYVGDPAAMRALAARHRLSLEELPAQIRRTADYLAGPG